MQAPEPERARDADGASRRARWPTSSASPARTSSSTRSWVAYDDRQNYLLEADIGVSTHLDHVETEFSFRTRILDYLWASLPFVARAGDSLADLVHERGMGTVVPPGDVDALEEALFDLLDDDERAAQVRANVARSPPEYVWSLALDPLVEFCRRPAPRARPRRTRRSGRARLLRGSRGADVGRREGPDVGLRPRSTSATAGHASSRPRSRAGSAAWCSARPVLTTNR